MTHTVFKATIEWSISTIKIIKTTLRNKIEVDFLTDGTIVQNWKGDSSIHLLMISSHWKQSNTLKIIKTRLKNKMKVDFLADGLIVQNWSGVALFAYWWFQVNETEQHFNRR